MVEEQAKARGAVIAGESSVPFADGFLRGGFGWGPSSRWLALALAAWSACI